MGTVLGLDLGTNSIGWALLEQTEDEQPQGLLACGVRIFQEAVDAKSRTPKNQARRQARAMRKLVSRRKMRRENLITLMMNNNLLPQDSQQLNSLLTDTAKYDPYQLRAHALDERLALHELGRAIYHLNQRRGFQSNRKAAAKKEEDGKIRSDVAALRAEMTAAGSRTLGEFLARQPKKRGRHTDRTMYQEEFEAIWQAQQRHYPDALVPYLKVAIHNAIFFQRPLKIHKNLVGKCTFEPSRKRASAATLEAQRFRFLQDLNHLAVKNPVTRELRALDDNEKETLRLLLEKQKSVSWNRARKALGLHEGEPFNLEEGKKKELIGNRSAFAIRSAIGALWDELPLDRQKALVTDILSIDNEQGFLNRMQAHWGFDSQIAEKLAEIELEPGYVRLSLKAINRVLPFLEKGMTYDKACQAAGYDHKGPAVSTGCAKLGEPSGLRNPVVQKALYEARKVINSVIRQYDKPATIRLEMARDMKLTRRQREEVQKHQREREKANALAEEILRKEFGIQHPTRADIQKYQMWQECREVCPYTGTVISREMLFSPEVDVEHILPYSRSLDDSYMNKTLCMAWYNRDIKRNRTPYEIGQGNPAAYLEMLQRVKSLPYPKRLRIERQEIDTDAFIERQLNDTRYICVEVKNYLAQLGVPVEVSKGEATSVLRRRWGLNRILSPDADAEKNRSDHRHHAVDAVVIALTTRGLFHKLSRLSAVSNTSLGERGFRLDEPWRGFYDAVQAKVAGIVVSHAASRKISGALHEGTAYGYSEHDRCFVYRKSLAELTANEVEKIRDGKIKELVQARLAMYGGNSKQAFGNSENPLLHCDGKTPIKTVRLAVNFDPVTVHGIRDKRGVAYKFFKYGNNHHVEIIENVHTGKRKCLFVTALEAANRARRDRTVIVRREHGADWRFVMSLMINDIVQIANNGEIILYRTQLMAGGTQMEITFKRLNDALSERNENSLRMRNPDVTKAIVRKVEVDSLGGITTCND